MNHPESQFAQSFDGIPIAYREYGSGGPAVLICNGIGCNQAYLNHLIVDLAHKRRVIIWDYRGHVDSPTPSDPRKVTIDCCLADMEAVVEACGLKSMVLAGFSMGVQISLEYLHRHPEQVLGLIALLGTSEYPLRSFMNLHGAGELAVPGLLRLIRSLNGTGQKIWSAVLSGPWVFPLAKLIVLNRKAARKEDFESWRKHLSGVDAETFLQMGIYLGGHSAAHVLPQIQVPSLVVAGDKDNFTPIQVSRRMYQEIPSAEWFEVKGGTHGGLFEFPQLINPRVESFLEQHFDSDSQP